MRRAFGSCEPCVDLALHELPLEAPVLQIPPHRIRDENRVLGAPRYGPSAQEPILPGTAVETATRGIDATCIGGKQRALLGRRLLHTMPQDGESGIALPFSSCSSAPTKELGELAAASGVTVHLETRSWPCTNPVPYAR